MDRKNLTLHQALELYEELNMDDLSSLGGWPSDNESTDKRTPGFVVLEPPDERPDAVSGGDWSDEDETGNPDRLPRRLLNAPAEFPTRNAKIANSSTKTRRSLHAEKSAPEPTEQQHTPTSRSKRSRDTWWVSPLDRTLLWSLDISQRLRTRKSVECCRTFDWQTRSSRGRWHLRWQLFPLHGSPRMGNGQESWPYWNDASK